MSKRKLQWFVDNKHATGWDDPRFPTVQGVVRRGMQGEALKEFMPSQGASKNNNLMECTKTWATNKKIIDPIADRSVTHNAKSHIGEPLREPRGVRVGYLACDNLIALGEDLSGRLFTEHACR